MDISKASNCSLMSSFSNIILKTSGVPSPKSIRSIKPNLKSFPGSNIFTSSSFSSKGSTPSFFAASQSSALLHTFGSGCFFKSSTAFSRFLNFSLNSKRSSKSLSLTLNAITLTPLSSYFFDIARSEKMRKIA